jgi:hypothetical protein
MAEKKQKISAARRKQIACLFAADCCQAKNTFDLLQFARAEGVNRESNFSAGDASALHAEFEQVIAAIFDAARKWGELDRKVQK